VHAQQDINTTPGSALLPPIILAKRRAMASNRWKAKRIFEEEQGGEEQVQNAWREKCKLQQQQARENSLFAA